MTPRTRAGLVKFRPAGPGSRVALVAPASPFDRAEFDAGVAELRRLGFEPVFDDSVFERHPIVAGPSEVRAHAFAKAMTSDDIDVVIAVRGGYGSAELLPWLDTPAVRRSRTAVVGYSDITALHGYLNCHAHVASVHGAMIDGRLSKGTRAYDEASFLASLSARPLGALPGDALDVVRAGQATGPIFGGTLTQLAASFGTPYEFKPPPGYILFFEEVGERPYRLRRLLTQMAQGGRLAIAAGVVIGHLKNCDEPNGTITARDVMNEFFEAFPGPVVLGVPSGHTPEAFTSFPLGVEVRVSAPAGGKADVVFDEAAAE
jgi:muramoyltetrapeptide carboxypeptidase